MGCTSSKYTVDGDKAPKKEKPNKKDKNKKKNTLENGKNGETTSPSTTIPASSAENAKSNGNTITADKVSHLEEGLEFIDKDDGDKLNASANKSSDVTLNNNNENEDAKKEVTTYQTTVIKHIEKKNDELLEHLKDEAFATFQNLLKQKLNNQETSENIKSSIDGDKVSTSTYSSTNSNEDLISQIKTQAVNVLGKTRQDFINSVVDTSVTLIKEDKVKNMNELQENLEKSFGNSDLIKKIINSATGFLTAKGTEAGTVLSGLLADVSNGLQGALIETEKTTVKVTRTITERIVNAKGEIIEKKTISVVDRPVSNTNVNTHELKESLASKVSFNENVNTIENISDLKNSDADDKLTREHAEQVVNTVVNAAIHILNEESSNNSNEEKVDVASEFYKNGKGAAEELVKIVDSNLNNNNNNNNNVAKTS